MDRDQPAAESRDVGRRARSGLARPSTSPARHRLPHARQRERSRGRRARGVRPPGPSRPRRDRRRRRLARRRGQPALPRQAASRRRHPTSPDLSLGDRPADPGLDPADRITLDDNVRIALQLVLQRLTPAERTAFVLHDVFQYPFEAIGDIVGRTPAACRQLAAGPAAPSPPTSAPPGSGRVGRAATGHRAVHRRLHDRRSRRPPHDPRPRRRRGRRRRRPRRHRYGHRPGGGRQARDAVTWGRTPPPSCSRFPPETRPASSPPATVRSWRCSASPCTADASSTSTASSIRSSSPPSPRHSAAASHTRELAYRSRLVRRQTITKRTPSDGATTGDQRRPLSPPVAHIGGRDRDARGETTSRPERARQSRRIADPPTTRRTPSSHLSAA